MSEIAERVTRSGQTHSMELIFFPLFLLLIVGIVANEYGSSGIQTTPTEPTPFCQFIAICYPTNTTGCDNNVQNCNITAKTTFSFLNPNSPFTLLVQGNVLGFLAYTFNSAEMQNIINNGYATCIPQNLQSGKYTNSSGSDIRNLECLSFSIAGINVNGNATFPNVGIPMNATSNNGNNSQWNIVGCQILTSGTHVGTYPCQLTNTRTNPGNNTQSWFGNTTIGANPSNFNNKMSFYGFYVKNGTMLNATSGCTIYGSSTACNILMPWLFHNHTTFTCPSTHFIFGLNINATTYYCLLPVNNPTVSTTGNASLPNAFAGLSFLFGVILFFLGLGFAVTSAVIGFSVDAQGTRLAQVMGIGILVWSFIYGEFGSWLNFLPFNLSIISFISLTAIFFLGLYWRTFAWD